MSEPRYMSLSTLAAVLDVAETTIEGWVAQGNFPVPKKVGPNGMRRWSWREVETHISGPRTPADAIDDALAQHKKYEEEIIASLSRVRPGAERIYFVQLNDFIKIGFSEAIQNRIYQLLRDTPYRLRLLHHTSGDRDREQAYHLQFHHLRVKGEWFRAQAELLDFIEELKIRDAR